MQNYTKKMIDARTYLFILRGFHTFVKSDDGLKFVAKAAGDWIYAFRFRTACNVSGSLWENEYCESSNCRFKDELLNGEIFYNLRKSHVLIKEWRKLQTKHPKQRLGLLSTKL